MMKAYWSQWALEVQALGIKDLPATVGFVERSCRCPEPGRHHKHRSYIKQSERGRESESERERESGTNKQKARERDRKRQRERERDTYRETERERERYIQRDRKGGRESA